MTALGDLLAELAETARPEAMDHLRSHIESLPCLCYDTFSMEYSVEPCDRCSLDELVNGASDDRA